MGKRRVGTGWKAILTSAPISTKLLDIIRIQEIGEKLGLDAQLKKRFLEYCNFINRQLQDLQLKNKASFGWADYRDGGKQYYRIFIGGIDQPHFLDRQENLPLLEALKEIVLSSGFASVEFQGSCYTGSIILKE